MKDRYYRGAAATLPTVRPAPASKGRGDLARGHALNWAVGVGILTLCGGIVGWIGAKSAGAPVTGGTLAGVPVVAVLAAGVAFAVQLIRFTGEDRAWLYELEVVMGEDLDGDGIAGDPAQDPGQVLGGSLVRGVDGALHRIDTTLSDTELQAVKRALLVSGEFTVRGLNAVLGDDHRASSLRVELYALGILEKPRPRTAAKLTAAGTKAVMRWA